MSYYLVVFIRKINLSWFTNFFLSKSYRTQGGRVRGSFACIYFFKSNHQRHSLKKDVLNNFPKFLRTSFLQTTSKELLLFDNLLSDNLLTGQHIIDLCGVRKEVPGKKAPRKKVPEKITPQKYAPRKIVFRKIAPRIIFSLDFCCFWHYLTIVPFIPFYGD